MIQLLSILAILVAIALPVLDYAFFRPRRRAFGRDETVIRGLERVVYLLFVIAVAGMVLSSVFMLAFGSRMHGWMLILHMTLAPLFSLCVAGLAVIWMDDAAGRFDGWERVAFCVVVVSSFLTILSAMLSMMTWFGSDGQRTLLNLHRYSALVLFVAAAYQAWRLLTKRRVDSM